jgi:hypothetical protein
VELEQKEQPGRLTEQAEQLFPDRKYRVIHSTHTPTEEHFPHPTIASEHSPQLAFPSK